MDEPDAEFNKLRKMVRTLFPPEQQGLHLGFITTLERVHRSGGGVRVEVAAEVIRRAWRRTITH